MVQNITICTSLLIRTDKSLIVLERTKPCMERRRDYRLTQRQIFIPGTLYGKWILVMNLFVFLVVMFYIIYYVFNDKNRIDI